MIIAALLAFSLAAWSKGREVVLAPAICSAEESSLRITLLNAHPDSTYDLALSYYHILGDSKSEDLVRNLDGYYESRMSLGFGTRITLKVNGMRFPLLVNPGENLDIAINTKLLRSPLKKAALTVNGGAMDEFNTQLANFGREYEPYFAFDEVEKDNYAALKGKDAEGFREVMLAAIAAKDAKVKADKRLSESVKNYIYNEYMLRYALMSASAQNLLQYANQSNTAFDIPADMYDEIKMAAPFSKPEAAYSHMAMVLCEYAPQLGQIMGAEFTTPTEMAPVQVAQQAGKQLKAYEPLSDEQLATLRSTAAGFYPQLAQENDKLKAQIEENSHKTGYAVKEISDKLVGEDIFRALVAPYRGRPVLVDFWATWCGPCRAAMKTIVPIKEEMAGRVAFIYVTGPSSPAATWKNMITDIHGDHYYVTKEQWNQLLSQFESQGIPTYVIVDAEGNVQSKYIGFPGEETMHDELTKALEK